MKPAQLEGDSPSLWICASSIEAIMQAQKAGCKAISMRLFLYYRCISTLVAQKCTLVNEMVMACANFALSGDLEGVGRANRVCPSYLRLLHANLLVCTSSEVPETQSQDDELPT